MRTTLLTALTLCLPLPLRAAPVAKGQEQQPERPWTLMVYGAADNNADGPILHFLNGVRRALDDDPGMELILFLDRSEGFSSDSSSLGADFTGARVYRLRKDSAELLDASSHFPGMNADEEYEVDSADPRNVGSFVAFCKERFPARKYGLMIYSHADGCTMCPDEESGGDMHIPQLREEVGQEASVDFLALELCNMGGIEIAYEWRPGNGGFSAEVLVAIPNAGPPLDWDRAFARIRSEGHAPSEQGAEGTVLDPATMTAAQFGTLVIEEGHLGRKAMIHPDALEKYGREEVERFGREAAGCYDLRQAAAVKRAVDAFAVQLAGQENAKEILEDLRGPGSQGTVLNYVGDVFHERPYVDLYDLCDRAAACEELSPEARATAKEACAAVDTFVIASFGMYGLKGFRSGVHGVFIAFPDGDAQMQGGLGSARVWRRMKWYTPHALEEDGAPYGRWSFLADGATPDNGEIENWFELLDAWFDDTTYDPGGFNLYVW